MWATKKAIILCIGLAAVELARAENTELVDPPLPSTQKVPFRATSYVDYLGNRFSPNKEKWADSEPRLSNEAAQEHSNALPITSGSAPGVHWDASSQHPVLEYKFSDQGTAHIHVGRHGSMVGAAWRF